MSVFFFPICCGNSNKTTTNYSDVEFLLVHTYEIVQGSVDTKVK